MKKLSCALASALAIITCCASSAFAETSGPFSSKSKSTKKNFPREIDQSVTVALDETRPIYGLALTGQAFLDNERSLVRIVLVGGGKEYLVYEGYPRITRGKKGLIPFTNECHETCALDGINATELKVIIDQAIVKLSALHISYSPNDLPPEAKSKGVAAFSKQLKKAQDAEKVKSINESGGPRGRLWQAGRTRVSEMTYAEKKSLFQGQDVPNLFGFEYYAAGVFEAPFDPRTDIAVGAPPIKATPTPAPPPAVPTKDLVSYPTGGTVSIPPESFDLRALHGENWLTGIRDQGWCGSCWDFAAVAAIETAVNRYFNQHVDFDLSEQQVLSCANAGSCGGGYVSSAMSWAGRGIVSEAAMPYRAIDANGCDYDSCEFTPVTCPSSFSSNISVSYGGSTYVSSTDADLKRAIMRGGVAGSISAWSHAMGLVGYGKVKAGDFIYSSSSSSSGGTVQSGDSRIGKTYWIFKNSWGAWWGEAGFTRVVFESGVPNASTVTLPITVSGAALSPACYDKDSDGLCSWGVGARPSSCPASCAAQPDCDDSNAGIGVCQDQQVAQAYAYSCYKFDSTSTYCEDGTGSKCPAGYYPMATGVKCGSSGGKRAKTYYYQWCVQYSQSCSPCPSGQVLGSYSTCSGGAVCDASTNRCSF